MYVEYVFVCIECKMVVGYKGFLVYYVLDVMFEDDFICCDLIINVMVQCVVEDGVLVGFVVDLYGGQVDLVLCMFWYVFDVFMEDLVCILCLVCFVVCFVDFYVVFVINVFMQCMVQVGEVDVLVVECVWQEIVCGLMEVYLQCMFVVLCDCGVLVCLLLEFDWLWGVLQCVDYYFEVDIGVYIMMVIEMVVVMVILLLVCFVVLVYDFGKGMMFEDILLCYIGYEGWSVLLIEVVCQCLCVFIECCELVLVVVCEYGNIYCCDGFDVVVLVCLLECCDVLCKFDCFCQVLQVCEVDVCGCFGFEDCSYLQMECLLCVLEVVFIIDVGVVVQCYVDNLVYIK